MTPFNRQTIRKHFSAAAVSYDDAAILQRQVAEHVAERFELLTIQPKRILDLGAGTGILTKHVKQHYPEADVFAVDLALAMLQQCQKNLAPSFKETLFRLFGGTNLHAVNADGYRLPFADGSMDMIVSNLMLQWVDDLDAVFKELRRVLRPEGLILFTTFGPDTLKELRAAWAEVDDQAHVNSFIDMHDIGDALIRCGFGQPVMDVENFTLTYQKPISVLKDLKAIGATNANLNQQKGLMGKQHFTKMLTAYEKFRQNDLVPATYEVVHGHAWAAMEVVKGPDRDKSGIYEITLDDFAKQTQKKGSK